MPTETVINAYLTTLHAIKELRPNVPLGTVVQAFMQNPHSSSSETLQAVHRKLLHEFRGLAEQAGIDVDLLPVLSFSDVQFAYHEGVPSELKPAMFLITASHSNPQLDTIMTEVPTYTVIEQRKQWQVLADPLVVPKLRDIAREFDCEFIGNSLDKLRELAKEKPVVGSAALGPKRTVDVSLRLPAEAVEQFLLKQLQGRLMVKDQLQYRLPAAKLSTFLDYVAASPYTVELSHELALINDKAESRLEWNGTIGGLSRIPLDDLTTITPAAKKRLLKGGYQTARDVLVMAPRKYVDKSNPQKISSISAGETVALIATIKNVRVQRQRKMVSYYVHDGLTGIGITFFNAIWLADKFSEGDRVLVYGKVSEWGKSAYNHKLGFNNPMMEHYSESYERVFGIYPQSKGVLSEDVHAAVREILSRLPNVNEDKPESAELGLYAALTLLHQPGTLDDAERARARLAYEELLDMQILLAVEKLAYASYSGISMSDARSLASDCLDSLPYPLTDAQQRVWLEISHDLADNRSMHRLLQGDVGSGKTTIALLALLQAVSAGYQVAVLAPTEILATQLFDSFRGMLTTQHNENICIELLTNKVKPKAKEDIKARLGTGTVDVVVGTHALLSEGVDFHNLGLVVVDEQHRFGVEQRSQLSESREDHLRPDTLVMTATPIPRTAALTVFGALDVSILDELPPGRSPIKTRWINSKPNLSSERAEAWKAVRDAVQAGQQAYVVCPLVDESDKLQVASAVETYEALGQGALSGLRLGLVHGQMKHDERSTMMAGFRAGDIDVLIATTVIEVGVNVPNASVIVILDPQRFGMAQLHQLRGRVGRSNIASSCYLYGQASSDDSTARLQALTESTDGFKLSEIDLDIRGPGQVFGAAQSGISDLAIADLATDFSLLEPARKDAEAVIDDASSEVLQERLANSGLSPVALQWLKKS